MYLVDFVWTIATFNGTDVLAHLLYDNAVLDSSEGLLCTSPAGCTEREKGAPIVAEVTFVASVWHL